MTYQSTHPYILRSGSGEAYRRAVHERPRASPVQYDGVHAWAMHHSHCPVCLGELVPVSAPIQGDDAAADRLRHALQEDEARCPLTTLSYQPQEMAVHHMRDVVLAGLQRGAFIRDWARHYRVMKQLAPSLTVRRLTLLIDYADVLNLWSYPAIRQQDLPYVLLVMAGFIRRQGPEGETLWVRFCFDGSVQDVGDLWHDDARSPRLFQMVYRLPVDTPFPTSRELMHFTTLRRGAAFLDGPDPWVRRADVQEFQRFLAAAVVLDTPETAQPDPGVSRDESDQ